MGNVILQKTKTKTRHSRVGGGAKEIRTPDPLHAMEMRYQLRHSPKQVYTTYLPSQIACDSWS